MRQKAIVTSFRRSVICLASLCLALSAALGAPGDLLLAISNPTPAQDEMFGKVMVAAGKNVVVGVPNENSVATDSGAVYVYTTTGQLVKTIDCPDRSGNTQFGYSLAVSGKLLLASAPYLSVGSVSRAGAAYLIDLRTGNPLLTFANPTPYFADFFGVGVGFTRTHAAIGCPGDSTKAARNGMVYLYDKKTGAPGPAFAPPRTSPTEQYMGQSLALVGKTLVVGAPGNTIVANTIGYSIGALHVYDAANGAFLRTIDNPRVMDDAFFGNCIAASTKLFAVGSVGQSALPHDYYYQAGAVYVFDSKTLSLKTEIPNPYPQGYEHFGASVAFSGNNILVGAPDDDHEGNSCGRAYLFNALTGERLLTLSNPQGTANGQFGKAVAACGKKLYVGAPGNTVNGRTKAGQVFVFQGQ